MHKSFWMQTLQYLSGCLLYLAIDRLLEPLQIPEPWNTLFVISLLINGVVGVCFAWYLWKHR